MAALYELEPMDLVKRKYSQVLWNCIIDSKYIAVLEYESYCLDWSLEGACNWDVTGHVINWTEWDIMR